MHIINRLRHLFFRNTAPDSQFPDKDFYVKIFSDINQICARLPEGKADVRMGDGCFNLSLKWNASSGDNTLYHITLDGKNIAFSPAKGEVYAAKGQLGEPQPDLCEQPSKQQRMMKRLKTFLELNYALRYNRLTDRTECAVKTPEDPHHLIYKPVDERLMNTISLSALEAGVDCWDRDVKRYVQSANVSSYHPFTQYFETLPAWDGKDRVTELAQRVSKDEYWVCSFHRWMLALAAGWMGQGAGHRHANAVAPILVSTKQGMGKSSFCRMLLPTELRHYFTESFDLNNISSTEAKLAAYGLINLDEFDKLPASRMPLLKNLMQMEALNVRRAYRRSTEPLERIASFIGTSNRKDLLTDASGSRRFICIEVEQAIDCTTPVEYAQLYAQLKQEILQGSRTWFSKQEEADIQKHNKEFYRSNPMEEILRSCFRFTAPGETGAHILSAADIFAALKKKNPKAMSGFTCMAFSKLLSQLGQRVHTRYGNGYWVCPVGEVKSYE